MLLASTRLKLHQRIGIGGVDDNLGHANLKPRDLRLGAGSDKRADSSMRDLRGELTFGQRE